MPEFTIDNIKYVLNKKHDFSWLSEYGKVFRIFDQNDSGNISFGIDNGEKKFFIKFAGADTINSGTTPLEAIQVLKDSVDVYKDLKHPHLLEYKDSFVIENGFAAVYNWFGGDSLHAAWRDYTGKDRNKMLPECTEFEDLPLINKLELFNKILGFHIHVASKGYIAVDFYDGSLIYNHVNDEIKICDIDFYARQPYINKRGRMWGSSRFMSPEEFELGAVIDEQTNVFTMGAVAFGIFGGVLDRSIDKWIAGERRYKVALKAVSKKREDRYKSLTELFKEWRADY